MRDHAGPSQVLIGTDVLRSIKEHAAACAPNEACGVLVGRRCAATWEVSRAVAAKNVAAGDRTTGYQIDPEVVLTCFRQARRAGTPVLGFYHSHPPGDAAPSPRDRDEAWADRLYLIVSPGAPTGAIARGWLLPEPTAAFVEVRLIGRRSAV